MLYHPHLLHDRPVRPITCLALVCPSTRPLPGVYISLPRKGQPERRDCLSESPPAARIHAESSFAGVLGSKGKAGDNKWAQPPSLERDYYRNREFWPVNAKTKASGFGNEVESDESFELEVRDEDEDALC